MEKDPEEDEELDERMGSTRGQWHYSSNRRGEDEILTGSRPWWAGLEERLPLDVDSLSSGERRWLDHLYAAATCALYSCPSSAAGSVSPSSPLFSPSLPASADSSSPAAALELAPRLCQALLHALRQLRSETCDVEEQEPFWCAMNLPPISLADLLRASRASVSDGDHRMATSTSTTMTTTTSTARTSRRLITAPPAGFVGCDLGAFFRSEVEPSPASRSSPPPDLFALPRDSVQMTASSPIRQVPFILMARLKSGNASVRRETDLRKGVGLYLEDRSGCLACEMLEPDPSAVGQIILISSANFIPTHTPPSSPDELPGYLEISQWVPLLDPSNPQASPASIQALGERYKPLVPRHVALRAGLTKELFDHESGEPSAKRKKKEQVSIVGKVTALSPVKWTHDKPQFLLQLNLTYKRKSIAGATREVSVLVLFGERECARWYPCLVMDKNYLITRLRPAKLFEQSEVFAATAATSLHLFEGSVAPSQVLNQSRETSLLLFDHPTPWDSSVPSSPASPSPSQSPSRSPSPSPNPSSAAAAVSGLSLVDLVHRRLVNYEGRITGYLGHGVFELDDRLDRKLFLSHYHTPHLDRVLRIGNLVRLYNVHLIVRPWHPVPYSSDDFSGLVEGFGCCSYSRVSVVQFGSDCQPPPPLFSARKRGSLETYLRRYPLSAAPWILHVYPSLVQRWHSDRRILFAGEDLGLLHTLCRVARLQQTNIHLWNEFTNHRACCITRPILGLPEVPTLKEFLVAAATLKRPPGTSLHAPFVVCSSELPRPVVLVGKLTGATELSDDTGRVSVEIIGLDAGMLDAYVCLPAFRLAFDPAAGLCVVAAIRDVVVHSPLAALEQQQAIPPAQEIKKEAAHGFVVMVLDRLVHKPNTGLSLQSLCVEAVHLPTPTSAALGGEGLRPPVITLELPAPRLTRYYAALRPGGVYGLNGVSAVDGSRGERHRLHPAGRIESVQLVSADNGRPLLCCSEDQLPAAPSIVASRRAVTLHDAALAEALPRLLNPTNDLQTVHELLEVEYKQTGGPYGAVQPALRDERAVVSFACIVVSVLQATPESLAQRRVVCADHLHAPPADTITVSADCYVMPRSLLPGVRAVFRNVQRQVSPGFEVRCQLQATSSVRVLSLPTVSAVLNAAALPIERAYDHVADACLYDLQCRPCLRLSLLRLRCTVTAFILVTFSLGPGRELRAEAEASIDDGTGEAKLLLSGPLAAELLGLSIEDTEVLKRGLQRHGIFKHGQAEEGGRNAGRWRAVSPPPHVLPRPLLPPSDDAGVAGPNLASAPPLTPAHELLLKEKMRLVTRPSQRFLITCGVKLPSRQQHNERGRWHDPRRQKPVDAKDAGGKGLKQHTHAPPRLWLEANSVVRASPSQLVM